MSFDVPQLRAEALEAQTILRSLDDNGVLTLTLNRPKRSNSLIIGMYYILMDYLNEGSKDPKVAAILLIGNGPNFCGGNDLTNFLPFAGDREMQINGSKFFSVDLLQPFCEAFINCTKPLVAVVQGASIGVGFTLLGLCDEVYASENAFFQAPLVKLAQGPEMCSSYTFPKVLGYQKAFEVIVGAKVLKAQDLLQFKMINDIAKTPLEALDMGQKRVQELSKLDRDSLISAKKLLRYDRDTLIKVNAAECLNLQERWSSENLIETIMNFFQSKQSPSL